MINKVEHLGIAVTDIDISNKLFAKLLGKEHYKLETVDSESVITSFFKVGEQKIELLQSTDNNGPIAKFIEKRKEGAHHLAFHVDSITDEIKRLKKEGFEFISETPKKGADNKIIVFLHPKTTNGVLIELCQNAENKQ
ncbi:methylmalonyl-CoA epimerase [Flavobacteriaceae bacterium]|jgi:methylmalonyl-CoA/ethylmalonyl-CoA epimerase|nr:methylmalonyl-CoA epimerase [Flavobacteriaceae bacterium]MDC1179712.1 methylmalonyl-CoA epimerase [Flavobacteriaceae bacterium]